MDQTFFIFWELVAIWLFYYGMKYNDVRYIFLLLASGVFYMLSLAAYDITKDYPEIIFNNVTTYTLHYVNQEAAYLNLAFAGISFLFFIAKLLFFMESILSFMNQKPKQPRIKR